MMGWYARSDLVEDSSSDSSADEQEGRDLQGLFDEGVEDDSDVDDYWLTSASSDADVEISGDEDE